MKPAMHPAVARMYEAARLLLQSQTPPPQARVAALANVSAQTLNNWEQRGPSAQGLLDFEAAHGVSATWLASGRGPMWIAGLRAPPRSAEPTPAYRIWPLSDAVLAALNVLDGEALRRVENSVRAQLGMAPEKNVTP